MDRSHQRSLRPLHSRMVRELAKLQPDDVLYDLYCGTGAIAIYLSPFVKRAVGIEVTASAIQAVNRTIGNARMTRFIVTSRQLHTTIEGAEARVK